jgi:hypothetical protein
MMWFVRVNAALSCVPGMVMSNRLLSARESLLFCIHLYAQLGLQVWWTISSCSSQGSSQQHLTAATAGWDGDNENTYAYRSLSCGDLGHSRDVELASERHLVHVASRPFGL